MTNSCQKVLAFSKQGSFKPNDTSRTVLTGFRYESLDSLSTSSQKMALKGDLSLNLSERQVFRGVFQGHYYAGHGACDPVSNSIYLSSSIIDGLLTSCTCTGGGSFLTFYMRLTSTSISKEHVRYE